MSAVALLPAATPLPAASAVAAPESPVDIEALLAQIKRLDDAGDIGKVMKAAASQFEKVAKAVAKVATKKGTRKALPADPNRGKQLEKPRAWVNYVLQHAQQNGWESFEFSENKTDKLTQTKVKHTREMPASACVDGVYVFDSEVAAERKPMTPKYAMTLSKLYKVQNPDLYAEFEAQYVPAAPKAAAAPASDEVEVESAAAAAPVTPKKAAKAKKGADAIPAAAKKAAPAAPKKAKKAAAAAAAANEWVPLANGKFSLWTHNGTSYLRNNKDHVFTVEDDQPADWVGIYRPASNDFEECDVPEEYCPAEDDE